MSKAIEVAYVRSSLLLLKLSLQYIYIYICIYVYIYISFVLCNFSKPNVIALYVLEFRDECLATLFDNRTSIERSHQFIWDRMLGGLHRHIRRIGCNESTKAI
jgi:hypothetical protein